jgi:hypothetical protein
MNAPPPLPQSEDARDLRHLELLVVFHFIVGGFEILMSGFVVLHYWAMRTLLMNPEAWKNQPRTGPTPQDFFHVFVWFYIFAVGFAWLCATANITAAVMLKRRTAHLFCVIAAGTNFLAFPFGTALGVFTIIVLTRDSVRRKFAS